MSTALVAAPVDTATPLSGTGLLESGSQLAAAIASGDWVAGSLAGVGVVLDGAAAVVDPLGSLIGAGLGWMIDHLEPLKGWFDDFTGDAGEVAAFGRTWANIQEQLHAAGRDLTRVVGDVDDLAGEAMDAYRRFQGDAARHLGVAAAWAGAMSTGLQLASTVVQVVHDLVRDVLSQLVGSIIAWAVEAVCSLGTATPLIVAQVATKVSAWSAKVGKTVIEALSSCRALVGLLDQLVALMRQSRSLFDSVLLDDRGSVRLPGGVGGHSPGGGRPGGSTPESIARDLEALKRYTGPDHREMNAALRGEIPMTPELREKIDAAVRALDRLPDYVGTVLRGERLRPDMSYLDKFRPGETVTVDSFLSTSRSQGFRGSVQYEIESLHGKSLQHISLFPHQDEVLFRPGTRFFVQTRSEGPDTVHILMRELE